MSVIRSQCKDEAEYLEALRNDFAAKALPACIAVCGADHMEPSESKASYFARKSYECADAMLKERAK